MTKPQPKPLGTALEVPEGVTVVRPDNREIIVSGGLYVLDVPGVHVVDGKQLHAGDADAEPVTA